MDPAQSVHFLREIAAAGFRQGAIWSYSRRSVNPSGQDDPGLPCREGFPPEGRCPEAKVNLERAQPGRLKAFPQLSLEESGGDQAEAGPTASGASEPAVPPASRESRKLVRSDPAHCLRESQEETARRQVPSKTRERSGMGSTPAAYRFPAEGSARSRGNMFYGDPFVEKSPGSGAGG